MRAQNLTPSPGSAAHARFAHLAPPLPGEGGGEDLSTTASPTRTN